MDANSLIELGSITLELLGVGIIALGALYSTINAVVLLSKRVPGSEVFRCYRQQLGSGILLGLELLVAADIINTVVIEPTLPSVGALAIIVLIRTFLSFTLEVEMTGRWPWQGESDSVT